LKVARVYLRVSTKEQDLERQESLVELTKGAGYYIAKVYREKASGASATRPELLKMIEDLQPDEVVVAEKLDRISRLPLPEATMLIASIRAKGAKLAVPGVVDFSDLAKDANGVTKIVIESVQEMLLKLALQGARDDYEDRRERQRQGIALAKEKRIYKGRVANTTMHDKIIKLRGAAHSIHNTADLLGCSVATVTRVWAKHRKAALTARENG
jgi:DNA invertase Pin-like site-specific DNA recombinase